MHQVVFTPVFDEWKDAARTALAEERRPEELLWVERGTEEPLLSFDEVIRTRVASKINVPTRFVETAKLVVLHKRSTKWHLLYSVLWRITHGEPDLLSNPVDPQVLELAHLAKEVAKDAYRMTAFLRFREVKTADRPWFVAWYEPEHDTLAVNAEFFVGRFANMCWSILTPRRCMHWDGTELSFTPGVTRASAPKDDEIEPLWLTYYGNIFNPARIKPKAMQAQLLKRNWKNLPEAVIIEPLLRAAPRRTDFMLRKSAVSLEPHHEYSLAQPPETADLTLHRQAAASCRACPLWRDATCTVYGEGPPRTTIMLVGEQPGDQEDRAGKPFVGPAGQVLQSALSHAGLVREQLYVTNAVKHFKWEPRGKRRIHQKPNSRDIAACRPWLAAELRIVQPQLVVCLGATAVQAVFGTTLPIQQNRGRILPTPSGINALITVHPSSLLRMPDEAQRAIDYSRFVEDLRKAAPYAIT